VLGHGCVAPLLLLVAAQAAFVGTLAVFVHGTVGAAIGTTWAIAGGARLVVLTMLAIVAAAPDLWRDRQSAVPSGSTVD
jgi:hypothetical protein